MGTNAEIGSRIMAESLDSETRGYDPVIRLYPPKRFKQQAQERLGDSTSKWTAGRVHLVLKSRSRSRETASLSALA
jgi:hypothetical protein